jgi:chromosome segregation ATPase
MNNSDSNSNRKAVRKWWLIALSVLPLMIIVLWLIFLVHPQLDRIEKVANQTTELNKNFFAEIQKIETIGSQVYWGMNILTKEDMQSLKKILFALKAEVDKAIDLCHRDTINIVDRVNLYVTIGIVLLTLLGVFLPVIVQSFGKEEIKELKEKLKINTETLDKKTEKFSSDIEKLKGEFKEELKINTGTLDKKTEKFSSDIEKLKGEFKEELKINTGTLNKKTEKFSSDIEKLKGEFKEELKIKAETLDEKIENAENGMKEISSKIGTIDRQIEEFSSDIEELKEKLENEKGSFNEQIEDINRVISDQKGEIKDANKTLEKFGKKIEADSEKINKISAETKNIPPLKLSYALLQALDKNSIRWYSINKNKIRYYDLLIGIFDDINASFKDCKSEKISPRENLLLKNSLSRFKQDLESVLMMSQFQKIDLKDFEPLSNSIYELIENKDKKEETLFDSVIGDIETLIESFRDKKKAIEEKKQQYS